MVDVTAKPSTQRRALARGTVSLTPEIRAKLLSGDLPKGEGLAVARVAGIQAAKETWRLIPLCHQISLSWVAIHFAALNEADLEIRAEVRCQGPTGVEMEALTAVSLASPSTVPDAGPACNGEGARKVGCGGGMRSVPMTVKKMTAVVR